MDEKKLTAITVIVCLFACSGLGVAMFVPERKLQQTFNSLLDTFAMTGQVVIVALGLGMVLFGLYFAIQQGWILNLNRRLAGADVIRAEREASLVITVAPPGSQVYASEVGKLPLVHKPLYLSPGKVNGVSILPTPEERQAWAFYQLTQNISRKPELANPEMLQVTAPLPESVDLGHYLVGAPSVRKMFLGVGRLPSGQVQPITAPLEKLVHIATGGSSGFGKSTFMQALAYQCLEAREPAEVTLLDTQGVTFTPFLGHDRLLYPLASEPTAIAAILGDLVGEMKRREQLYAQFPGVASLSGYNQVAAEPLPVLPIFFDEFGMAADNKQIAGFFKKLVQGGRKFGLYVVAGAQTWGADDIATSIRANLSTSVQFYARSKSQSRILLEDSRAIELTRPGQAYARIPGMPDLIELQAPDPGGLIETVPMLERPAPALKEIPALVSEPDPPTDKQRSVLDLWDDGEQDLGAIARLVYGDGGRQVNLVRTTLEKFGRIT